MGSFGGFASLSPHPPSLPSNSLSPPEAQLTNGLPPLSQAQEQQPSAQTAVNAGANAGGVGAGEGSASGAARVASLKLMRRFSALSVKVGRDDELAQVCRMGCN